MHTKHFSIQDMFASCPDKRNLFFSELLAFYLLGAGHSFSIPFHHIDGILLWPRIILLITPIILTILYFLFRYTKKQILFSWLVFVFCSIDLIAAVIAWKNLHTFAFTDTSALLQASVFRGILNMASIFMFTYAGPCTIPREKKKYNYCCILSAIIVGSQSIFSASMNPSLLFLSFALFSYSAFRHKTIL